MTNEEMAARFRRFGERECDTSPLYAALTRVVAASDSLLQVAAGAPDRHPTLYFASVQRALADNADDPLAAYYASLGGTREPDADLAKAFESFVAAHEDEVTELLRTGETQTNEPLRAAQLRPALGWAQACFGRPLALIEVGASAGLLLHADRYAYDYEFEDGTTLEAGTGSDVLLRMPVTGSATSRKLAPFVTRGLRIASRVGLDVNPLNPADPDARAWLRALIWPEHDARRAMLDAALAIAQASPVRLRKGDALKILADAVGTVSDPAVPCIYVSNTLAHFSRAGRAEFVELLRKLGSTRDLVVVLKEGRTSGVGLFTDVPPLDVDDPAEDLTGIVYQSGRERIFSLGMCGPHGSWLGWAPTQLV